MNEACMLLQECDVKREIQLRYHFKVKAQNRSNILEVYTNWKACCVVYSKLNETEKALSKMYK